MEASSEITVEKGVRAVSGRGPAWAGAARSALDAFGPLPDAHRFLAGESVMGRHVVEDLAQMDLREIGMIGTNGEGEPALPTIVRFAKLKPVRDAFEARSIEYWRKVYAALRADPLDWRRLGDAAQIPYPEGPSGALVTMAPPC